jgi:SAM-dependent MidA family methyltransferase
MFGEIIGAALLDCWRRAGSPDNAVYAELGPGRGILASDALRVMRRGGFAGDAHFVETSPILREMQKAAVPDATWHEAIEELPARPLLLVANEFLDALPIRQHVDGMERRVIIAGGGFAFDRDGEILETSPAREAAVETIARGIVSHGGVAIIIDYGHEKTLSGDTLQAVRGHAFSPILVHSGEQDLTAHVDFEAVGRAAEEAGASVTSVAQQGEWLNRLGIEARADALTKCNPGRTEDIRAAMERLVAADQMGKLFKVVAIHAPNWPAPGGFD